MHGVDHVADLGIYDTQVESSLLDIFTRELGNSYVSIVPQFDIPGAPMLITTDRDLASAIDRMRAAGTDLA